MELNAINAVPMIRLSRACGLKQKLTIEKLQILLDQALASLRIETLKPLGIWLWEEDQALASLRIETLQKLYQNHSGE